MNTILLATKAVQNREFRGKVKKAGEVRLAANQYGHLAGTLNDERWIISRILPPGLYRFHRTSGGGKLALIWTRAFSNGFSPS
jgi:hypothetical protein